jgi:hypothetical protein
VRAQQKKYFRDFFSNNNFYAAIAVSIITFVGWLLLFRLPLPRQIGLSFRYDLTSIAVFLYAICFITLRLRGKWGDFSFTAVFMVLSILPLSGLWASGQTEPYTLFGLIPISDAGVYYKGALRFLRGLHLTGIATFRPIAPALFSLLLRITSGNLQAVFALQALVTAFAAVIAVLTVRDQFGALSASLFAVLIYFFQRPFTGTALTESFGVAFGLLGFSQLLVWSSTKKNISLFAGSFLLMMGLNIRAGAYFILPALTLATILFRKSLPKHALILAICGFLLAWLNNAFISHIYSSKLVGFSSNIFHNLYQLATNSSSWRDLAADIPNADLGDTFSMVKLIIAALLEEPRNLFKALGRAYGILFSLGRDGAFGFLEGERVHASRPSLIIASAGLFLLSLLGSLRAIIRWIRHHQLFDALITLTLAGILLSAPILFSGNYSGMRFFAATMGFQCVLPALGLHWLLELAGKKFSILKPPTSAGLASRGNVFAVMLIIFVLILLPLNALGIKPTAAMAVECENEFIPVDISFDRGSYVTILADESLTRDYLPAISASRARASSHGLATNFSSEFKTLIPPFTLISAINRVDEKMKMLVMLPHEQPPHGESVRLCAAPGGFSRLDANGWLFSENAHSAVLSPEN